MVWMVEKKIIHHTLDTGFERVRIPIRVKFEFEIVEGVFVPGTLSKEILYNEKMLEKHFPKLNREILNQAIHNTVDNKIMEYLKEYAEIPARRY